MHTSIPPTHRHAECLSAPDLVSLTASLAPDVTTTPHHTQTNSTRSQQPSHKCMCICRWLSLLTAVASAAAAAASHTVARDEAQLRAVLQEHIACGTERHSRSVVAAATGGWRRERHRTMCQHARQHTIDTWQLLVHWLTESHKHRGLLVLCPSCSFITHPPTHTLSTSCVKHPPTIHTCCL